MELKIVSLETAKALKEVGFSKQGDFFYDADGDLCEIHPCFCNETPCECGSHKLMVIAESANQAPTQALVQMWLREKYNIHIEIGLETVLHNSIGVYNINTG